MTVGELKAALEAFDDTKLVCVDTAWSKRGIYPIADGIVAFRVSISDEQYDAVIITPSEWTS